MRVEPVTLTGRRVELVPLGLEHLDALCGVGLDPEVWRTTGGLVESRGAMREYVKAALGEVGVLAFAATLRDSGEVVGSTQFAAISVEHRRVEIGSTWLGVRWLRTFVNAETNLRNLRSRAALARLGATEEGVLRRHVVQHDGRPRDSVFFSIIDEEWPGVRARIEANRRD